MEADFFYDGPFILFPRREVDKNDPCKHFDTWTRGENTLHDTKAQHTVRLSF